MTRVMEMLRKEKSYVNNLKCDYMILLRYFLIFIIFSDSMSAYPSEGKRDQPATATIEARNLHELATFYRRLRDIAPLWFNY